MLVIWLGMIAALVFAIVVFARRSELTLARFGHQIGHVSRFWGIGAAAAALAIGLWQRHVLTRPLVRRLFVNSSPESIDERPTVMLMPMCFVIGMVCLVVATFAVLRGRQPHYDSRWHSSVGPESIPAPLFDSAGNEGLVDEKTNSVSVVSEPMRSCRFSSGRDKQGRRAIVFGWPPKQESIPMIRDTLYIRLPGGKEREFPLPRGAATRFIVDYPGQEAGGANGFLQEAVDLFDAPAQRAKVERFLDGFRGAGIRSAPSPTTLEKEIERPLDGFREPDSREASVAGPSHRPDTPPVFRAEHGSATCSGIRKNSVVRVTWTIRIPANSATGLLRRPVVLFACNPRAAGLS